MWNFPSLLVVPASSPAKSVAELIAYAKTKPSGLNFGSQGSGSGGHILGEMLKTKTGAPLVHVPFRGAAPAVLDLVAGRIDLLFSSYASVAAFVQSGKLRALAVTGNNRLKAVPNIPTMAEVGVPGVDWTCGSVWSPRPDAEAGDRQAAHGVRRGAEKPRHRHADGGPRHRSRDQHVRRSLRL